MTSNEERYLLLCQASSPTSPHPEGVVVGVDLNQEWLLPWWWEHYSRFNDSPVTFVDLGLSPEMQQWCKEKGYYVKLPIHGLFVAEREDFSPQCVSSWEGERGNRFWPSRQAWFRKALACLQSPYESSLWIDLDCEIKGSIKSIFPFCRHPSGLSIMEEPYDYVDGKIYFNSGVIAFQRGTDLIREWAVKSLTGHRQYVGDQDVLTALIRERGIEVGKLPAIYNTLSLQEATPDMVIRHWAGRYGKEVILQQIRKQNLPT